MKLNNFMCNIPILIINLPDSIDRKNNVLKEFQDYNNLHFIDAVDGRNTDYINKYNIIYKSNNNLSNPLIAVICSHSKAIKYAFDNNYEKVCIFEDDVHTDLIKSCNFNLDDICKINQDWEAIQLFYTSGRLALLDETYTHFKTNGLALLDRSNEHSGTCYIINRKGIINFLSNVINVDEKCTEFIIKNSVIDPEHSILGYIKTYIVNRQIFYYYFETMTFNTYTNDNSNDKYKVQDIHIKTKQKLLEYYS
jgi:GR25 family glycosyltransferase involved in LPS biosynthesis